ncbi:peptidyl-prolyl cis-trans isomerase [Rhodothermus profundi]|uniref:Parvulin-like peptidyl-prolyl isomerase n=1 Tax=Rhodothermus profundi TaxID=633813 RepID=A0A1M6RQ78_9BACT|nr:peptidyl-prolyl cis-trans isomerase [Rhodothermus profundi]SHK34652.1 Parvulin-like peptidyl-prolyl isomerase [Rhodothermus profundi]
MKALSLALVGLLLWSGCRSDSAQRTLLAEGPGVRITADAFREAYLDYLLRTGLSDHPRLRRLFLEQMIQEALVVYEARRQGLERTPAYQEEAQAVETKLLVEAYARRVLYDTVQVREQELAEAFVRLNTEVRARHLWAPTRAAAESLYARLQAGASFEELAAEVFQDSTLARSGGDLGWFTFDEMDPAFEDVAFRLQPGEISPPVQTAYGYSIIQVTDRFTRPILTEVEFAKKRPLLERYLRFRKQQAAREACARSLADSLQIRFYEATLRRLYARIAGRVVQETEADRDDWMQAPLLTFGPAARRVTWTVADFREQARLTGAAHREAAARSPEALKEFARGLVVRHVLAERARTAGLHRTPDFAAARQQALDRWLYQYVRQQVQAEAVVPEDTLRAFYEAHRADFRMPARRAVWEILVPTEAEAHRLQRLLATTDFVALARRYSRRPGAATTGGYLGFVTQEQLGKLGPAVFRAREGDVLGPLRVADGYVLLRVGAWQPERPMTLEEARPLIERQLKPYFARKRWRQYRATLMAQYAERITRYLSRLDTLCLTPSTDA